eukprot:UN18168
MKYSQPSIALIRKQNTVNDPTVIKKFLKLMNNLVLNKIQLKVNNLFPMINHSMILQLKKITIVKTKMIKNFPIK